MDRIDRIINAVAVAVLVLGVSFTLAIHFSLT